MIFRLDLKLLLFDRIFQIAIDECVSRVKNHEKLDAKLDQLQNAFENIENQLAVMETPNSVDKLAIATSQFELWRLDLMQIWTDLIHAKAVVVIETASQGADIIEETVDKSKKKMENLLAELDTVKRKHSDAVSANKKAEDEIAFIRTELNKYAQRVADVIVFSPAEALAECLVRFFF